MCTMQCKNGGTTQKNCKNRQKIGIGLIGANFMQFLAQHLIKVFIVLKLSDLYDQESETMEKVRYILYPT